VDESAPSAVAGLFAQESERLQACNLERLAAPHIHARKLVIAPDHIGLGLRKFCPIAFVGVARELGALSPDYPGDLVFAGMAAFGADQVVRPCFGGLIEKIPFFHLARISTQRKSPVVEISATEPSK